MVLTWAVGLKWGSGLSVVMVHMPIPLLFSFSLIYMC